MRELMSEFKELRLHGMAGAWEELSADGGTRIETSRWLVEHLLQAEHTDRVMRSIGYRHRLQCWMSRDNHPPYVPAGEPVDGAGAARWPMAR